MQKEFLKHSFIYTFAVFINRGITFLLLPIMTHYLHPLDYGIIDFINIAGTFLIIICGLEIQQGVARFIAEQDSFKQKKVLFSSAMAYLICSYLILFIVANIFNGLFVQYVIPIKNKIMFNVVIFSFLCQGVIYYFSIILRFDLKPKLNVFLNAFTGMSILIFSVIFVIGLKYSLNGAILALLCGNLVGVMVGYLFVKEYLTLQISWKSIKQLIGYSYPLVISSLSSVVMLYSDRIMLKYYFSLSDVGIFGVGYRFASIISILMVGVQSSIGPLVYNSMNKPTFKKDLAKLFNQFFAVSLVGVVAMSLFAVDILHLMVNPSYYSADITLKNMSIAILLSQLYIFFPGLQINKKTRLILAINLISGLLNLLLCYFFVKTIGLNGASIANMIAYAIVLLVYIFMSQTQIYIPYDFLKNIISMLIVLPVIILTYYIKINLILAISLFIGVGLIIFLINNIGSDYIKIRIRK